MSPIFTMNMLINDKLNDKIIDDLLYEIAVNIHSDDLSQMSTCNTLLNCVIHDPIFIRNTVYSIDSKMKGYIINKKWDDVFQYIYQHSHLEICKYLALNGTILTDTGLAYAAWYGHLDLCEYFVSLGATNFNYAIKWAASSGNLEVCKYIVSQLSLIHI